MTNKDIELISRQITYLLEKQYRKAYEDGYNDALDDKVSRKQLDSWLLSGRFQAHKIYEDIHKDTGLPPTLLQLNNAQKGKQTFKKLTKFLDTDELENFFNDNF